MYILYIYNCRFRFLSEATDSSEVACGSHNSTDCPTQTAAFVLKKS